MQLQMKVECLWGCQTSYLFELFFNPSISDSTIILQSSSTVVFGFHPKSFSAFAGLPIKASTSANLKYFSLTFTISFPVFLSIPFSLTPAPSHIISVPITSNANSLKKH